MKPWQREKKCVRFIGGRSVLTVPKEQGITTEFNSNYLIIWQTVQLIPQGKVASYGKIADISGLPKRARMVGKALALLPKKPLCRKSAMASCGQLARENIFTTGQ